METLDSLLDVTKPNYSVDVKEAIDRGEVTANELWRLIYKLSSGDFGKLDAETARRFQKSIETGDRDIYGIYESKIGDVVMYYDATEDSIDIVTKPEYMSFFKADWMNPRRMQKKTRLSTKQPDQQWKEGQRREIIREVTENAPVTGRQLQLRQKTSEYAGVYPYMDYTRIAKMLSKEQLDTFKNLARERNIPIKKLFAVFGHQHAVQNLNIKNAFDYVVKHIDDPYIFAKDSIGDTTPWQNIEVVNRTTSDLGTTYHLVKATRKDNNHERWFVTQDPSLENGYVAEVSAARAKKTFDDFLLMDKLSAKYGEKEGYRKFMFGAVDSVKDSENTETVEKELRKKGFIYPEEGVIRVDGNIALVRDYMWSMEHAVNIVTGDREWLRNTDYVPDDYEVEDAASDTVNRLINEERDAVKSYSEAIGNAPDNVARETFNHIRSEEIEHISELKKLGATDAKAKDASDDRFAKSKFKTKTAGGEEIVDIYKTVTDYMRYYIIGKDKDKFFVGVGYKPNTGMYDNRIVGFENADDAYDWIITRYGDYDVRSVSL